jgi:hypothetical protein
LEAAYEAGRLLNQINWHMQQAWLLWSRLPHQSSALDRQTRQALCQLALALRRTQGVRDRDRAQKPANAALQGWQDWYRSLGHRDALENQANELRYLHTYGPEIGFFETRNELCSEALKPVTALYADLRQSIRSELSDSALQALELGECVDRVVRPPNVFRYLYQPEPLQRHLAPGDNPFTRTTVLPAAISSEPEWYEHYLANRSLQAGEIPPQDGWRVELEQRWGELGLPSVALSEILGITTELNTETLVVRVDQVDQAARASLASFSSEGREAGPALRSPVKRDEATEGRDKWIYEECHKATRYKEIIRQLGEKPKAWDRITTSQGIRDAASRYAKRHKLPPIPKRQNSK